MNMARRRSEHDRLTWFWREVVYQRLRDLLCPEVEESTESERQEAFDWVYGDSAQPASFLWACSVSGLDPEDVRNVLRVRGIR